MFTFLRKKLICQMKREPYSLCTDCSNNKGLAKMNLLLVRVFDDEKGKVISQLLDMETCKLSTAEALFGNMDKIVSKAGVSWENCIAVGVDNTAVNIGSRNSIMTHERKRSSSSFFSGCPCHIVHNITNKGAQTLGGISNFDIENFLVDLFHWFDKSSKRKVSVAPNSQCFCSNSFFVSIFLFLGTFPYEAYEYQGSDQPS